MFKDFPILGLDKSAKKVKALKINSFPFFQVSGGSKETLLYLKHGAWVIRSDPKQPRMNMHLREKQIVPQSADWELNINTVYRGEFEI